MQCEISNSCALDSVPKETYNYFMKAWIIMSVLLGTLFSCSPAVRSDTRMTYSDLDTAVSDMARGLLPALEEAARAAPGLKVAVLPFAGQTGGVSRFGSKIAAMLQYRLFTAGGPYILLERERIDRVVEEQKLYLSGMFDESAARGIGRLLGADLVITGTVYGGRPVVVSARLVGLLNGAVLAMAEFSVADYIADTSAAPEIKPRTQDQDKAAAENPERIVYRTKTGTRYHRDGCEHLQKSRIPVSLKKAGEMGLKPCGVCKP